MRCVVRLTCPAAAVHPRSAARRRQPLRAALLPQACGIRWHGHGHGHGHSHGEPIPDVAAAQRITVAGLATNVLLTGSKAVVGVLAGSASLIGDAIHSGTDLVSDGVTLAAVHWSRRPPTPAFPLGFGKMETMGSALVAALLLSGSAGTAWHSLDLLLHSTATGAPGMTQAALGIAVFSILSKEVLYQLTFRLGEQLNSPVLKANAWHHRADALSSVLAFVGVGGSLVGVPWLDPVAGLLVAGLIGRMGVSMAWHAALELVDGGMDAGTRERIECCVRECAASTAGEVREVRTVQRGPFMCVDVTLAVDDAMAVAEADGVAVAVQQRIVRTVPHLGEVRVTTCARSSVGTRQWVGGRSQLERERERDVRS